MTHHLHLALLRVRPYLDRVPESVQRDVLAALAAYELERARAEIVQSPARPQTRYHTNCASCTCGEPGEAK